MKIRASVVAGVFSVACLVGHLFCSLDSPVWQLASTMYGFFGFAIAAVVFAVIERRADARASRFGLWLAVGAALLFLVGVLFLTAL
jgi:hypothetical protein